MSVFTLTLDDGSGSTKQLIYDNSKSTLEWADTKEPVLPVYARKHWNAIMPDKKSDFGKKHSISVLKISLGLSCNYSCSYCSQRFEPNNTKSNLSQVDRLVSQILSLNLDIKRIEFWGGEPFVYWKAFKVLAEKLIKEFPEAVPTVITNGSLLDIEKNEWLDTLGFSVGISHDGPGYHARGLDPLQLSLQRQAILDLYNRLHPKNRISINAMLHRGNQSRASIQSWLENYFGKDIVIGEGGFVDAYSQDGLASMLEDTETVKFRKRAFFELKTGRATNFYNINQKVNDFIESVEYARPSTAVGQKCGMDKPNKLAIDMEGNVLTCQNVSAASTAQNGQPHKLGHISDLASVRLTTSTHWSNRPHCSSCPVLQLCKGSCMFLEGEYWDASCNAAYSDNVAILAYALYRMTGLTLVHIEGEGLPESRKNLWKHVEVDKPRKVIPIKQIG